MIPPPPPPPSAPRPRSPLVELARAIDRMRGLIYGPKPRPEGAELYAWHDRYEDAISAIALHSALYLAELRGLSPFPLKDLPADVAEATAATLREQAARTAGH